MRKRLAGYRTLTPSFSFAPFSPYSGDDIILSIPFVMQTNPEEAIGASAGAAEQEVMDKLPVFVNMDDGLPEYDEVNTLSLPSYTSLRRNSVDSVFSAALTPDDMLSPAVSPANDRNRRHSSALVAVPPAVLEVPSSSESARVAVHSPARRRNSLSVFGRREKSDDAANKLDRITGPVPDSPVLAHPQETGPSPDSARSNARRRSAASVLLENPVSATANRAMRRLRSNTLNALSAPSSSGSRRNSLRAGAETAEGEEDPAAVLASFKARYMTGTPVTITLDPAAESR